MENGREQDRVYVTRPALPDLEEYVEEIRDLWDSRLLTNMGSKHDRLEAELARCLDAPNLALFANGHLALEAAPRCSAWRAR